MSPLFGKHHESDAANGADTPHPDPGRLPRLLIPDHSPARAGDKPPPASRILWDLAAEAIQLLEQARLIVPDLWYSGNVACFGYHSTRAGRDAVQLGVVEELVEAVLG